MQPQRGLGNLALLQCSLSAGWSNWLSCNAASCNAIWVHPKAPSGRLHSDAAPRGTNRASMHDVSDNQI